MVDPNLEERREELPVTTAAMLVQAAFAEAMLSEAQRKWGSKSAQRILARWDANLSPGEDNDAVVLIRGQAQRVAHLRHRKAAQNWVRAITPTLLKRLSEE